MTLNKFAYFNNSSHSYVTKYFGLERDELWNDDNSDSVICKNNIKFKFKIVFGKRLWSMNQITEKTFL